MIIASQASRGCARWTSGGARAWATATHATCAALPRLSTSVSAARASRTRALPASPASPVCAAWPWRAAPSPTRACPRSP
eukprot:SM005312S18190  [mRNA]  locus=s5312:175:708:+ [translate_table: standard]